MGREEAATLQLRRLPAHLLRDEEDEDEEDQDEEMEMEE